MALTKLTDIRKSLSVEVEDLKVNGITTFTGSVSIGGTLTYEDVTNIDSVGIITARTGIDVVAGDLVIPDSIIHRGDTDTKIRFSGADTFAVETGGGQRLTIGSSGNVNIITGDLTIPDTISHRGDANTKIRFPADETISFECNGEEILKIGKSSTELLRISGPVDASTQQEFGIGIAVNDAHTHPAAQITFKEFDASDSRGDLLFYTRGTNNDVAPTEKLRITSDGKVGIGTVTPSTRLDVYDTSGLGILSRSASTQATDSNKALKVRNNSTTDTFNVSYKGQGYFAGKVGIGTDNPSSQLEVNAASAPHITSVLGGTDHITMTTGTTGGGFNVTTGNNFAINHQPFANRGGNSNITERLSISSNGDMRIGGGTPSTFGSGTTVLETYNSSTYTANLVTSGTHILQMIASQTHGATSIGTRSNHNLNLCANDSTKVTITPDGEVLKPSNPMFKARRTSNQSVSSNGWVTIQFNSDTATGCFDVGSNFDTSNHRFTAPVTGYYQFGLNQRIDGGNGDYFRVAFSVNGDVGSSNNYPYGMAIYKDLDGFSYYSFSITSLIYLTAGQYVRAEAYASSDTTWYLQDESIFYGYLVG